MSWEVINEDGRPANFSCKATKLQASKAATKGIRLYEYAKLVMLHMWTHPHGLLQKLKESENGEAVVESPRNEDDFAASFRLRSALQDAIMTER